MSWNATIRAWSRTASKSRRQPSSEGSPSISTRSNGPRSPTSRWNPSEPLSTATNSTSGRLRRGWGVSRGGWAGAAPVDPLGAAADRDELALGALAAVLRDQPGRWAEVDRDRRVERVEPAHPLGRDGERAAVLDADLEVRGHAAAARLGEVRAELD